MYRAINHFSWDADDEDLVSTFDGGDGHQVLSIEKSIKAGETKILTFRVLTTKNVSGSFYNEVLVESDFSYPIFEHIGVTNEEYETGFSWNSGMVTVPTYDSQANADNTTTIDANMALVEGGGVAITSFQVY